MIKVCAPATSANCLVGFDCVGLAVDWWATFTFEESDHTYITGCPEEYQNEDNLVIQAFKSVADMYSLKMPTFHLHIDSDIPSTRGLGSSSTCVVAGILGANAWLKLNLSDEELLKVATSIEGHPDNVAPCLFGQMCISFIDDEKPYLTTINCDKFYGLAMIPSYHVSTAEARKLLPETIPFKQAVKQAAYVSSFVQALHTGDETILRACRDFLHEPYRKTLIGEYDTIHAYCQRKDIVMWISGSGSTMLAISQDKEKIKNLKEFADANFDMENRYISIAKKGAYVEYE